MFVINDSYELALSLTVSFISVFFLLFVFVMKTMSDFKHINGRRKKKTFNEKGKRYKSNV